MIAHYILLGAVTLVFLGGFVLAVVGAAKAVDGDIDNGVPLLILALFVVGIGAGCIAGIAYHDDGPACRLTPSSIVESPRG